MFGLDAGGRQIMALFGLGEISEQLAHGRVGRAASRQKIKAPGFLFHPADFRPHRADAMRPDLPMRPALHPAPNILSADQRNMIAEPLREHVDQRSTVMVFLGRHVGENLRAIGILLTEAFGEVEIDTAILLLAADR